MKIYFVAVSSSDEFDGAFAAMMRERPDAVALTADPFHQLHIAWIIDFLAKNRLPGMFQLREHVVAGGLMPTAPAYPTCFGAEPRT